MLEFIFWFNLGLVFYIYLGYPLTILMLAKLSKKSPVNKKDFTPLVSLIIPAYNEEKVIREKLKNSLSLNYPQDKLEIIVISDCSTDETDEIVNEFIPQGVNLIVQEERVGKIPALNKAVSQAEGEIIVFSDANSIYEKEAIRKLVRNFNDGRVGCVCGELKYITQNTSSSSAQLGENLYWRYEKFLKTKESQLHSLLIVNGSIYAIRKELFLPIDESLADDFVSPMQIAAKRWSVVYEPEAVAVEKASFLMKEQFKQKSRIIAQGYKATLKLSKVIFSSGWLRIFEFLFHKLLRWLVPLFLVSIFVSNLFLLNYQFYQIVFIMQLIFYLFALIGRVLQKQKKWMGIFYVAFYFCMVNFASVVGLFNFLTNREKRIWEKAESTR